MRDSAEGSGSMTFPDRQALMKEDNIASGHDKALITMTTS